MSTLDWLELGYWGLFLGCFLAATIVPFSSEIILTALLIAGGDPWACFVVATLGNWLGGTTNYALGRWAGNEWLVRWLKIKEHKIAWAKVKIDRYGYWIAFFSWLPFVGDLLCVAIGMFRLPFLPVLLFMLIGKALRFGVWILVFEMF